MTDPERPETDAEVLARVELETREEAMRVRRGEQEQGASKPTGRRSKKTDQPESPYGATYRPLDVSYADQVEELKSQRFKRKS